MTHQAKTNNSLYFWPRSICTQILKLLPQFSKQKLKSMPNFPIPLTDCMFSSHIRGQNKNLGCYLHPTQVLTFLICWLPHYVVSVLILYDDNFQWTTNTFFIKIAANCISYCHGKSFIFFQNYSSYLLKISGMLNPLLYAFASEWMRAHLSVLSERNRTLRHLRSSFKSSKSFKSRLKSAKQHNKRRQQNNRSCSSTLTSNATSSEQFSVKQGSQTEQHFMVKILLNTFWKRNPVPPSIPLIKST